MHVRSFLVPAIISIDNILNLLEDFITGEGSSVNHSLLLSSSWRSGWGTYRSSTVLNTGSSLYVAEK